MGIQKEKVVMLTIRGWVKIELIIESDYLLKKIMRVSELSKKKTDQKNKNLGMLHRTITKSWSSNLKKQKKECILQVSEN